MGFLGTMTGWDASKHAYNAVLASHLCDNAVPELKQLIAERIGMIIASVTNDNRPVARLLAELSKKPRTVQMNFIAIACDSLGLCSLLHGFPFQTVNNPYSVNSDLAVARIAVSQRDFAARTGIAVKWPGDDVRIDFVPWLNSAAPTPETRCEADLTLAITLADYTLLLGLIDRDVIAAVVSEVASHGLAFSTYDLAACAALFFFKDANLKETLREAQMSARLVVAKWLTQDKIAVSQARMFECELYEFYRS